MMSDRLKARNQKAPGRSQRPGFCWSLVTGHLSLLFLLASLALPAQAQDGGTLEYQVKAAFLLNFTKFVEWPPTAFEAPNSAIRICVLGEDPFGAILAQTVAGESVNNRRVEALRVSSGSNLRPCHVLFISRSERERVSRILADLRGSSVLTVSELSQFNAMGGVIEFIIADGKVRFEINSAVAEASGLRLSSRLLRVAMRVRGAPR